MTPKPPLTLARRCAFFAPLSATSRSLPGPPGVWLDSTRLVLRVEQAGRTAGVCALPSGTAFLALLLRRGLPRQPPTKTPSAINTIVTAEP